MNQSITGTFDTRRDAELAVERLVQEHGVERTDIFIAPIGPENSAGSEAGGSDAPSSAPSDDGRSDGAHAGAVTVSVDVNDDDMEKKVVDTFAEFGAVTAADGA
ncbi:MAG: hypothetical protein V4530_01800 [Pseudomonadota bacterium]